MRAIRAAGSPRVWPPVRRGPGQIRVAGHSGAAEREQRAMSGPARQMRRRLAPVSRNNCNSLRSSRSNSQSFGARPRHDVARLSHSRSTPSRHPGQGRPGSRPRRGVGPILAIRPRPAALGPAPATRAPREADRVDPQYRRGPTHEAWRCGRARGGLRRFDPDMGVKSPPFGSARTRPARVGGLRGARGGLWGPVTGPKRSRSASHRHRFQRGCAPPPARSTERPARTRQRNCSRPRKTRGGSGGTHRPIIALPDPRRIAALG